MRHVETALGLLVKDYEANNLPISVLQYIQISNISDVRGVCPIVSFTIQSDPIKEVGVNGLQATDMLRYTKALFISLDTAFPCMENKNTIHAIDIALKWQQVRTAIREAAGVEGTNAAVPIAPIPDVRVGRNCLTDQELVDIYDLIYAEIHSIGFKIAEAKDILFNEKHVYIYRTKPCWKYNVLTYIHQAGIDVSTLGINPILFMPNTGI